MATKQKQTKKSLHTNQGEKNMPISTISQNIDNNNAARLTQRRSRTGGQKANKQTNKQANKYKNKTKFEIQQQNNCGTMTKDKFSQKGVLHFFKQVFHTPSLFSLSHTKQTHAHNFNHTN